MAPSVHIPPKALDAPAREALRGKAGRRFEAILAGEYSISLLPMRCFPDPSIRADYELRCVCHFDRCVKCSNAVVSAQGGNPSGIVICACPCADPDDEYREIEHAPDWAPDALKVALLLAAHRLAAHEPGVMWAAVWGADTCVKALEQDERVFMPSAYDLRRAREFRYCSYGAGCAYARVAFPAQAELDFTLAIVGTNHDT